jgi:hypothetical protein
VGESEREPYDTHVSAPLVDEREALGIRVISASRRTKAARCVSPAAVVLMLVRCSSAQPARNCICAIPVETAQACKDASLWADVSAVHRCEVRAGREEVVMRRFIIAAVILLWYSPGFAQASAPSMGGAMGSPGLAAMADTTAPPPPGASAAAAALDGAGIPLGATDLFVGGLSPSPTDLGGGCPSSIGIASLGTGAIFSSDGTLSSSPSDLGGATSASSSGCASAPTAGDGPLGVSSTAGAAAAFGGGNIPLAATALPTTGLGGTITSPGNITPCSSAGASVLVPSLQSPLPGFAPAAGAPVGQVC